jgi:CheY-like chemotaxis protein
MLRCLIVDDSPPFLTAARGVLQRGGIDVVGVAGSGIEAELRVRQLRPDVVLVDIDLPGQSGFELVRRLHLETGPEPPSLILISTHAEPDYAELIEASPAVGFLSKTVLSADAVRQLLSEPRGT